MNNVCLSDQKPQISYPNFWQYTIFVDINFDENAFLNQILAKREFKIYLSKQNTKYKSINLSVLVFDEKDRLEIFENLKNKCKFVL